MNAEQLDLMLEIPDPRRAERERFDLIRQQAATRARRTGQEAARQADPAAFAEALRTIRRLALEGAEFSADDLRASRFATTSPGVIGAAFREASRRGWIVATGNITGARSASRRGGIQRTWRGA